MYQYENGYVGECVFDHDNSTKWVRPVRSEPPLPPYQPPDTLGAVLGEMLGGQPPKPWLTHPKGLTLGSKGALYTGEKKGIKKGSGMGPYKLAMDQLRLLPLRDAEYQDRDTLVALCNQVADIVDNVNT